jgi:Holliday junction DNA helicase RuvA
MIYSITGIVELKEINRAVINAGGIGYEIAIPACVFESLPLIGQEVKLLTVESVAMYGGGTTLYGFLTSEQRQLFTCIREFVPGTGAKKALDYMDKASKSLPDFRRAVLEQDPRQLVGIFGFSKKTAEKIIAALKDKLAGMSIDGHSKWVRAAGRCGNRAVVARIPRIRSA